MNMQTQHLESEKHISGRRKYGIVILVVALCISLLFNGVIVYNQLSKMVVKHRVQSLIRNLTYVIIEVEGDEGEEGVRALTMTDARITSQPRFESSYDELFVFKPVSCDGTYLLDRRNQQANRIILWSKRQYLGQRLILLADFHSVYVDDAEIDWQTQTQLK